MPHTIAQSSESHSLLPWILAGVGGAIVTAAGILWKALESRHAKQMASMEKALGDMTSRIESLENDMSKLRHERAALVARLAVAEAKIEAVRRHAKLRPLADTEIDAILGDPEDSHFGDALIQKYEQHGHGAKP